MLQSYSNLPSLEGSKILLSKCILFEFINLDLILSAVQFLRSNIIPKSSFTEPHKKSIACKTLLFPVALLPIITLIGVNSTEKSTNDLKLSTLSFLNIITTLLHSRIGIV